jgi:AcrR family transcriptional regulator
MPYFGRRVRFYDARRMTSPVTALSRERIVETAFGIVQTDGLSALSMRRIATELGTGTMSLYNYVPDKETLLRALIERVYAGVEVGVGGGWRDVAERWATSLRDAMLAHISLVPVIVSPEHIARLLSVGDDAVKAMAERGLSLRDAGRVVRAMARYVAGAVMLDGATMAAYGKRTDRARLDASFAQGLRSMLDGLTPSLDSA